MTTSTDLSFMIGVLRKIAKKHIEGASIDQAMLLIANEIQDGLQAFHNGETKVITCKQLLDGQFKGDLK